MISLLESYITVNTRENRDTKSLTYLRQMVSTRNATLKNGHFGTCLEICSNNATYTTDANFLASINHVEYQTIFWRGHSHKIHSNKQTITALSSHFSLGIYHKLSSRHCLSLTSVPNGEMIHKTVTKHAKLTHKYIKIKALKYYFMRLMQH